MTKMILAEFKTILKNLTWMDDESKQKAMEKVDFIGTQIGYPDSYDNPEYLDSNLVVRKTCFSPKKVLKNYLISLFKVCFERL